ncbi:hypothetical protein BGZ76_005574 [Entomortierella beljakovae]|nr:hypothetical protein BGZ76_005574 [Entomortierella beljakovae]
MRPQPVILEIPSHKTSSNDPKVMAKATAREIRDANLPVSPQPQQNSGSHHSHNPHHSHQSNNSPQHQQQHKVQSTQARRGSTDRGAKDSIKTRSSTPKPSIEHVGPYFLGRTLGKGSSGCVKLARHRKTNEQVAVKIISKASLANKAAVHRGIEREIAIMKLINHPHVIRLYDVYETEKELFLVMEYVSGGELFEYLVNKGRLDEAEALRFFQQIIVGLAFCHKRKICHRDLKPENLLLDDRMNVKIADFGMASLQKTGRLLETSCGSPHYASPEVVTGLKYDGSSSDIWSCGIILYALLTGHLPFDDENIRQLLSKVKAGKFYMPTDISPGARDLISRMLTVNPKRRITMQGVMMHPWFRMINPDRNTLGEPAEDPENGQPLLPEELDAEIILHMRWLFAPGPSHSDPDAKETFDEEALLREIEEKVTNSEENMEKLFYHLLCQHKTELLENYSSDDTDSTILDGPRRRADSFPNSGASVRSHTPDPNKTPRSPRDSPGSPLSPLAKISPTEPAPLTMNPLEAAVARAASAAKIAARTSSPSTLLTSSTLLTLESTRSKVRCDEAAVAAAAVAAVDSRIRQQNELKQSQAPPQRKEGESTRDASDKSKFSRISESNNDNISKKQRQCAAPPQSKPEIVHSHPQVIAPKPVSPLAHRSVIVSHSIQDTPAAEKQDNTPKPTEMQVTEQSANTCSIESQVLSTLITEAAPPPPETEILTPEPSKTREMTTSVPTVSNPTSGIPIASKRLQKPILHPIDVKASAGTTTMNVCASQHSRKYSDGPSGSPATTPMSPNGPKRPWFARLFDFKPQPLAFKSQWSAIETQERLETILKGLFQSNIQIECQKKPSYGIKCRYEGGVIDGQPVKAVKFKVEVVEKAGYLASSPSTISNDSSVSSTSSHIASSSGVASILANGDHIHQPQFQHHGNLSQSYLPTNNVPTVTGSDILASRRASDGGSILSSAAAAVTSSFAAATRNPFHHLHSQHSSSSGSSHYASRNQSTGTGGSFGFPPLPHHSTLSQRTVKVTLHQQQGANSTLKLIYEKLQAAWDQQIQERQSVILGPNGSELSFVASSQPATQRAPRGAAI